MRIGILILMAFSAFAQEGVTVNLKSLFEGYKRNMMGSVGKFKPADMDFKPTADVRTVREMIGHVADANYSICSQMKGETNPDKGFNAKKDDLIPALSTSFDYCLAAIDAVDGKMAEKTNARVPRDKGYAALHLLDHTALHYGNIITYMRIKGLVPLESEPKPKP